MTDLAQQVLEQARRALPPVEGRIRPGGLQRDVEVIRDRWGVPHIYAQRLHDLFFAQGFVTASERLFQLDFMLRLGSGRLAGLFSGIALDLDQFIRTVGWNRAGRRVADGYDDLSVEMAHAHLAGVRAWLDVMPARPPEYEVLDLEPQLPEEDGLTAGASAAVFMAWGLSTNWDAELLRAEIADRLGYEAMGALFPDASTEPAIVVAGKEGGTDGRRSALDILRSAPPIPNGQGSNNWVLAGTRTVTGMPFLCNDPHLVTQMPSIWFECHLSSPDYEASGVTLPFSPGIVIGHTAHHAWGFTNVGGDTQDLYLERLSDDGTAALHNGRWEPMTVHREEIEVRGGDPMVVEARETRHGPILDSYMVGTAAPQVVTGGITETFALRWTGFDRAIQPSTLYRMATARSFGEFREAVRTWECPGQNMVYADVEGTIGYQCTGTYPIRREGDGTLPVPGWSDQYEWDGAIPFEELPWAENPEEGFLATANQKIHDDSYPYLIGKDFLPPYRARRIVQMITTTEKHSRDTLARMHMDTMSIPARHIVGILAEVEPADDAQKEALSHLDGWDGDLAEDSVAACIYEVWTKHIALAVLSDRLGPELLDHFWGRRQWTNQFQYQVLPSILEFPTAMWFGADGTAARDDVLRAALDGAVAELTATLGDDMTAWRWGALHKVRFPGPLAIIPDLAEVFTGGVVETGGDEQTVRQSMWEPGAGYDAVIIPSWRQIIDLSDIDASVGIHTTGQSGNPASPHYRDFVQPWAKGEYHPLPFSREKVEEHAASILVLGAE